MFMVFHRTDENQCGPISIARLSSHLLFSIHVLMKTDFFVWSTDQSIVLVVLLSLVLVYIGRDVMSLSIKSLCFFCGTMSCFKENSTGSLPMCQIISLDHLTVWLCICIKTNVTVNDSSGFWPKFNSLFWCLSFNLLSDLAVKAP